MNEEKSQDELSDNSDFKQGRPWLFQPGQSGNPKGRPKGSKTLKTYVSQMLRDMTDEEKLEYLKGLPKDKIWEMAEGKAEQKTDVTSGGEALQPILVKFLDGNESDNNRDPEGV